MIVSILLLRDFPVEFHFNHFFEDREGLCPHQRQAVDGVNEMLAENPPTFIQVQRVCVNASP